MSDLVFSQAERAGEVATSLAGVSSTEGLEVQRHCIALHSARVIGHFFPNHLNERLFELPAAAKAWTFRSYPAVLQT